MGALAKHDRVNRQLTLRIVEIQTRSKDHSIPTCLQNPYPRNLSLPKHDFCGQYLLTCVFFEVSDEPKQQYVQYCTLKTMNMFAFDLPYDVLNVDFIRTTMFFGSLESQYF